MELEQQRKNLKVVPTLDSLVPAMAKAPPSEFVLRQGMWQAKQQGAPAAKTAAVAKQQGTPAAKAAAGSGPLAQRAEDNEKAYEISDTDEEDLQLAVKTMTGTSVVYAPNWNNVWRSGDTSLGACWASFH